MQRFDGSCMTIDFPIEGWFASEKGILGEYDAVILQTFEPGSLPGRGGIPAGAIKMDLYVVDSARIPSERVDHQVILESNVMILGESVDLLVVEDGLGGFTANVRRVQSELAFVGIIFATTPEDVVRGGRVLSGVSLCQSVT
jgi:hypothetical protein